MRPEGEAQDLAPTQPAHPWIFVDSIWIALRPDSTGSATSANPGPPIHTFFVAMPRHSSKFF